LDARLLTRLTNVALVAGVGMATGHLLVPARPGTGPLARAGFVASVALVGALAAWRERRALAYSSGIPPRGGLALWLAAGTLGALLIAALAYYVVHG
jgi:hypothetical protein